MRNFGLVLAINLLMAVISNWVAFATARIPTGEAIILCWMVGGALAALLVDRFTNWNFGNVFVIVAQSIICTLMMLGMFLVNAAYLGLALGLG